VPTIMATAIPIRKVFAEIFICSLNDTSDTMRGQPPGDRGPAVLARTPVPRQGRTARFSPPKTPRRALGGDARQGLSNSIYCCCTMKPEVCVCGRPVARRPARGRCRATWSSEMRPPEPGSLPSPQTQGQSENRSRSQSPSRMQLALSQARGSGLSAYPALVPQPHLERSGFQGHWKCLIRWPGLAPWSQRYASSVTREGNPCQAFC